MKSRHEHNTKQSPILSIITFIVSMACALLFINNLRTRDLSNQRNHAKNLIESVSLNFQAILKEYFDITSFWSTYISQHDGAVVDFERIASAIYTSNNTINSLQLAPDGIVTYSYPARETDFKKTNLFTDPIHRDDAKYSRLTRLTTITGPFDLYPAGKGIAVRTPVYVTGKNNISEFWGFSIAIINAPSIFIETHLSELENDNYDYQLKAINPGKGKLEMIACSTEEAIENPVTFTFDVHNTAWTFYVAPKNGWLNKSMLVLELFLGFMISILVAFSAHSLASLIRREDAFKQLSYVDSLTKLNNSRKFYEMLTTLQRKNKPFAIVYIDLNEFKPVNDNYGHKSGDELLAIVAKKITNCVRDGDGVFRIGGDEFTIVIPNEISVNGLANLTLRLKNSISRETTLENATVIIGASIGYARCPEDSHTYEEAILRAEEMMYADKKAQHAGR